MAGIKITHNQISKIDRAIFSSFIEQMGRAVYGGIYDPAHPCSDENGFRLDVIRLIKEMNVKYVRYPGGNFVSNYRWKDGVGQIRTPVYDVVWKQYEPNIFGTDEFMKWAEVAGVEPMIVVNLGSGSPQEAAELVEYCNCEKGYWAEQRKSNGRAEPYKIKYWCLGNEMDGDWQVGHKSASDYAEAAFNAAVLMKEKDPSIRLVLCGSSAFDMPSCPEWDKIVLSKCFDYVDFISMHKYYCYDKTPEGLCDFMASSNNLRKGIEKIRTVIEEVKREKVSEKEIYISLDEWNIWYNDPVPWERLWEIGPKRVENVYSSIDATVMASLLCTLINNCDIIKVACLAQLVNVIAPIMTGKNGCFRQTIFYPFKAISDNFSGEIFQCVNECEKENSKCFGEYSGINSAFAYDKEKKEGALLVCNLMGKEQELKIVIDGFEVEPYELIKMSGLPDVCNVEENEFAAVSVIQKHLRNTIKILPYSWAIIKFKEK